MKMKRHFLLYNLVLFGFLLGIHKGKIALWKDNMAQPIQVFPYSATMLPKADQAKLAKGIHVDTLDELYQLVEDYIS